MISKNDVILLLTDIDSDGFMSCDDSFFYNGEAPFKIVHVSDIPDYTKQGAAKDSIGVLPIPTENKKVQNNAYTLESNVYLATMPPLLSQEEQCNNLILLDALACYSYFDTLPRIISNYIPEESINNGLLDMDGFIKDSIYDFYCVPQPFGSPDVAKSMFLKYVVWYDMDDYQKRYGHLSEEVISFYGDMSKTIKKSVDKMDSRLLDSFPFMYSP